MKLARNAIKHKFIYSPLEVAFEVASSWSFCNDIVRNVVIFGVDNNSSFHSNNCKNNFLVLDE